MPSVSVAKFKENVTGYLDSAIEYNEVIDVFTQNGSAVVMSKDDFEAIQETFHLLAVPGMVERFAEALTAKEEDCVPLSEVWPDV